MKKLSAVFFAGLMLLSLASCSEIVNEGPTNSVPSADDTLTESAIESMAESTLESAAESDVEESKPEENPDSDQVPITVPSSLLSDDESGELTGEQIAGGFERSQKNDDGSITYYIKKDSYDDYVKSLKAGVMAMLDQMKEGEYSSIKDVQYNNELTEVVLSVDQAAYENSSDSYAAAGIGNAVASYLVYSGTDPNEVEVVVHIQTSETNEVLEVLVYPQKN